MYVMQGQGENVPIVDKPSSLEAIHEKPDWKSRILQDKYKAGQSENEVHDEASSQGEK